MTMANGTQQQGQRIQFKPRKTSTERLPDAPEGEWEALIPKGKCKVLVTQNGDPRVIIPVKLVKAASEENESFQNSEVQFSVIIFDDDDTSKRRAANMMKDRLRQLCEAVEVEFGEVYPTEVSSDQDFAKMFGEIEGKKLTVWTVHNKRRSDTGEEIVDTEVRFKQPGTGLVSAKSDDEDEDRPGKKPAAKGKARR